MHLPHKDFDDPWALLRQHSTTLAATARTIQEQAPDALLAAVLVEHGSEWAERLVELLDLCGGPILAGQVPMGILPRADVARALELPIAAQATLRPILGPPEDRLPALLATRRGLLVGSISLCVPLQLHRRPRPRRTG